VSVRDRWRDWREEGSGVLGGAGKAAQGKETRQKSADLEEGKRSLFEEFYYVVEGGLGGRMGDHFPIKTLDEAMQRMGPPLTSEGQKKTICKLGVSECGGRIYLAPSLKCRLS